jgi:hypothetical protein
LQSGAYFRSSARRRPKRLKPAAIGRIKRGFCLAKEYIWFERLIKKLAAYLKANISAPVKIPVTIHKRGSFIRQLLL